MEKIYESLNPYETNLYTGLGGSFCRECDDYQRKDFFPYCSTCNKRIPYCFNHIELCTRFTIAIEDDVFFCCATCYKNATDIPHDDEE